MRAVVFRDPSRPVEVTDVELDAPRPGEVRVRIAAAGVCHSDLHVRRGDWQVAAPLVMGHEGSGTVVATGAGVTSVHEGDRVILSWVPACGRCANCRAGHPARCELCADVLAPQGVLYDGTTRLHRGGERIHHYLSVSSFAEEAVVPESGAIPIHADAPLDVMALIGCGVATGVGAVRRTAAVPEGASVAVIGCGGVGLSVVQGARLARAGRVIAVDLDPARGALAQTLGATDAIAAADGDVVEHVRDLTGGGVDFAFDAIGKVETTEQAVAMLAIGGAAVVVGLPPVGARAAFDPLTLAEREQRILGSNYGGTHPHEDFPELVSRYLAGDLYLDELVSGRRPLEDAEDALQELGAGRALRTLLVPSLSG
jgi:S-(hydroxymethyl)glutathione dehydrogenase / alcohol dehydrogenase